ncbi:MAG TPA: hypothetical protein VGK00_01860 [Anaerolineales bacterium]
MLSITTTDELRIAYPGAMLGFLEVSQVEIVTNPPALDEQKRWTENLLRTRYAGFTRHDFLSLPIMAAYDKYYRRFGKTYHVLQQLESIVQKGKNLPNVSPLVDANFIAEVETLVLTAGHDVEKLRGDILMDVGREGDQFVQMSGSHKTMLVGDMLMRDRHGVCCTIIYGQDNISPISPVSSHVLYMAYAPQGVTLTQVNGQLQRIMEYIQLFSPEVAVEQQQVLLL